MCPLQTQILRSQLFSGKSFILAACCLKEVRILLLERRKYPLLHQIR